MNYKTRHILLALMFLLASFVFGESQERIAIERYSKMNMPALLSAVNQTKGFDLALVYLFLAAEDKSPSSYTVKAHARLDSIFTAQPTVLNSALMGTIEAIMARDCNDDIKATKHIGKALKLLDKAVLDAPNDPMMRIYRINSLVEVPEIFHVNERIKTDLEKLLSMGKEPTTLLIAARVAMRNGDLENAVSYANQVVKATPKDSLTHIKAKKLLEVIYE